MLIDTHCHLDFPEFDADRDGVIKRAKAGGIDFMINVGSSLENSANSVELAQKYGFIFASAGIHPHEADSAISREFRQEVRKLADNQKVVAIGEIGLDYYKNYSSPRNQRALFEALAALAVDLNKPAVIHNRMAESDTLAVLKQARPPKVVVHCFSGDGDFLKTCLEMGFFVSFTCNITYKKAGELRELARITPLERLMLETDAPFLSPEGSRGKRNEPINVKCVAQEIARLKNISLEEVAARTCQNAREFFGLG